jgi:hypothetical protein
MGARGGIFPAFGSIFNDTVFRFGFFDFFVKKMSYQSHWPLTTDH